jgi:hypothetical protein
MIAAGLFVGMVASRESFHSGNGGRRRSPLDVITQPGLSRDLAAIAPLFRAAAFYALLCELVGSEAVAAECQVRRLVEAIGSMPAPYTTDGEAVAYLRYVHADGRQAFILEMPPASPHEDPAARFARCTGYVCSPGDGGWGEAGRVSIPEMIAEGYDLDLAFSSRTLARAVEDYRLS